jgi:hypothetical protein
VTISETTLKKAVADGLLTADLAERLRAVAATEVLPEDPEKLRFISGFADIFVSLGLIMFFCSATVIGEKTGNRIYLGVAISIFSWIFSEVFARRQKLALSSILLTWIFLFGIFYQASMLLYGTVYSDISAALLERMLPIPLLFCTGFSLPYYWRFRTPIVPALAVACLFSSISAYIYWEYRLDAKIILPFIAISFGIPTFAAALILDYADQNRETTTSDIAFWLHFLSAPLIVHSIMLWIGVFDDKIDSFLILVIFLITSIISLLTDRRSIIVSGLSYAGIAVYYLTETAMSRGAGEITWQITYSFLFVGLFVISVSFIWHPVRRLLLRILPLGLRRLVPSGAVGA